MEINFFKDHFRDTNVYRTVGSAHKAMLNAVDRLNSSGSFTRIGDTITLDDGTTMNVHEIPKLNIGLLNTVSAKDNVMDFGSARYYKYVNSSGYSRAIFSMPKGSLCRPTSEDIDLTDYDRETDRYIHFWNDLAGGNALMLTPEIWPRYGVTKSQIKDYLDEAGISKGFFSVKVGSRTSEFFYSESKQYPLYKKEDYDLRYYTMTSSNFSYNKSVFSCLEPGTEITIAGEKYALKDDLTLDIPYGTDIYDIQIPKHTHTKKVPSGIDYKV